MNNKPLYKAISNALGGRQNCINTNNEEWKNNWEDRLNKCEQQLPHGSGIDAGCKINFTESEANKIIIDFSYHAMDENGFYCGWYDFVLTATPDFMNTINIEIEPAWSYISYDDNEDDNYGVSYDDFCVDSLLDYLHETFRYSLTEEIV